VGYYLGARHNGSDYYFLGSHAPAGFLFQPLDSSNASSNATTAAATVATTAAPIVVATEGANGSAAAAGGNVTSEEILGCVVLLPTGEVRAVPCEDGEEAFEVACYSSKYRRKLWVSLNIFYLKKKDWTSKKLL
jgi:hypothetical protein